MIIPQEDRIPVRTFAEAYEEWINEKAIEIRPSSLSRYKTDARRFFFPELGTRTTIKEEIDEKTGTVIRKRIHVTGLKPDPFIHRPLSEITRGDVIAFMKRTIKDCQLTPKTAGGLRILIGEVLAYAEDKQYLEFSVSQIFGQINIPKNLYTQKPQHNREDEVFLPTERDTLAVHCERSSDVRELCVALMLRSGLRVGELVALRWDHVKLDESPCLRIDSTEIQYDDPVTGKRVTGVQDVPKTEAGGRLVLLPGIAVTILRRLKLQTARNEFVCSSPSTGRRYTAKNMNDALKRVCKSCSIPYRSTHKTRKTYASTLVADGTNGRFIQSQLGHKSYSTTEQCYLYDMTETEKGFEELNRVFGTS